MQPTFCPFCKSLLQAPFIFCPNCGKNVAQATQPISLGKQLGVYVLSILLPPLGLWPGIKYLRGKNPNGKMVGTVAIVLTLIGTVITIVLFMQFVDQANKTLNGQLDQYQNLGY